MYAEIAKQNECSDIKLFAGQVIHQSGYLIKIYPGFKNNIFLITIPIG